MVPGFRAPQFELCFLWFDFLLEAVWLPIGTKEICQVSIHLLQISQWKK